MVGIRFVFVFFVLFKWREKKINDSIVYVHTLCIWTWKIIFPLPLLVPSFSISTLKYCRHKYTDHSYAPAAAAAVATVQKIVASECRSPNIMHKIIYKYNVNDENWLWTCALSNLHPKHLLQMHFITVNLKILMCTCVHKALRASFVYISDACRSTCHFK